MRKYFLPIALVVILAIIIIAIVMKNRIDRQRTASESSTQSSNELGTTSSPQRTAAITFVMPKKSAHWESNTPAHGAVLAAPPINVVIDFNFDLATPSAISITKDGQDYGVGETIVDKNKLAMRRNMSYDVPDGIYTVNYKACWPDKSCHDGNFQFNINRSLVSQFEDMRGKSEVKVDLTNTAFGAKQIRISRGTKVTWINNDNVEHFVNTDAHPAHTYFPAQNSRGLQKGNSYSATFTIPGIYSYHCSAHADTMTATIVVE